MLSALLIAAEQAEPDKTGFYIMGGVLVIWAVALTLYGMRSAKWPENRGGQRAVVVLSALLVAGTMASAILTS